MLFRSLTKNNLVKRGWICFLSCQFCTFPESVDHLFLECRKSRQVLFWLGQYQHFLGELQTISDVLNIGYAMAPMRRKYYLITFTAYAWTIWTLRNKLCFHHITPHTVKSIVLTITNLVNFWTGMVSDEEAHHRQEWLPKAEEVDQMPLQEWDPASDGALVYSTDAT